MVSLFASASPDGLEFVSSQLGFGASARDSATAGGPFADYGISGLSAWASGALAGGVGVVVTVMVTYAFARLARRVGGRRSSSQVTERAGA